MLPAGEVGEIFTRFAELPDFTYHNRPDERAAIDRDGFITSGDVGYLDADGYLFLCDRKRDMVISGGVNIYPAEIEAVLLRHARRQGLRRVRHSRRRVRREADGGGGAGRRQQR